jgi:hypothetical protein
MPTSPGPEAQRIGRSGVRKPPLAALGLLVAAASFGAAAQDRFEIQVYDSEVAAAGEPGLELHANYVAQGTTTSAGDELPTRHVLHLTLEPHIGLFGWGELGGYLQAALRPEGAFDYAGVKLRFKARWPSRLLDGMVGLALNAEISAVPAAYEANRWGTELRPIIDARVGRLYAALNPNLATELSGRDAGHPRLEPAAKLAFFLRPELSAGVEYYAGLGPLDALLPVPAQTHNLYAILDLAHDLFDVNLGVGRGLGVGDGWVAKAIVGIHPRGTPGHSPAESAAAR